MVRSSCIPSFRGLTLEVVLRAVFGLDPGPRLDAVRERLSAMLSFGDRFISLIPPSPGGRAEKVLERVGPFAAFARIQREADELLFELINERRTAAERRDDVLAMLLGARHADSSPMSDQELRDELMTMLVAGHETTASALAWALERLSRHPAVLRALEAEVQAGDGDAYLTATIYETLRRRPVLPNVAPRLVKQPVEIGGWSYPTGIGLVPNAYLVHHDPRIYPDPYAFRPERFLDSSPGTYTWIPFGGGRRRCLGASFAMLEMKLVLRALLRARKLRHRHRAVRATEEAKHHDHAGPGEHRAAPETAPGTRSRHRTRARGPHSIRRRPPGSVRSCRARVSELPLTGPCATNSIRLPHGSAVKNRRRTGDRVVPLHRATSRREPGRQAVKVGCGNQQRGVGLRRRRERLGDPYVELMRPACEPHAAPLPEWLRLVQLRACPTRLRRTSAPAPRFRSGAAT